MRIAVLSLTRDRLEYTQHCFASLHEHAGCDFDHYVLDQGSTDGTSDWLLNEYEPEILAQSETNLGISAGMNRLLDWIAKEGEEYDVIVKFDNDCELVQLNTLQRVCEAVMDTGWLLSPVIKGLNHPPRPTARYRMGGFTLLEVPQIGGIFLAAPASLYATFRFSTANPVWGLDDSEVCAARRCGYLEGVEAWHYETTSGQHARYPSYFERTLAEGKPAL